MEPHPPPRSVPNNTDAGKINQERRREMSIKRRQKTIEKHAELDMRASDLLPTWQAWVNHARPARWKSYKMWEIIAQARQCLDMEERIKTELEEATRALTVLDNSFVSCNFAALVVVSDDPAYRSNLTSFTLEHVAIQTMILFHYYRELTQCLGEELLLIRGLWGNIKSCSPPMLLNIDWSANHNAVAPDARMLTNMRVCADGERTRDAEVEQMPVFEKYKLTAKDIGPYVPAEWKRRVQEGKWFYFDFKDELPFYGFQKGQT